MRLLLVLIALALFTLDLQAGPIARIKARVEARQESRRGSPPRRLFGLAAAPIPAVSASGTCPGGSCSLKK